MVKIKIFTLNGYFNYGNRLQLFALAKSIDKISDNNISIYWPKGVKIQIKEFVRCGLLAFMKPRKGVKLRRFTKEYTPHETANIVADYSIVGSDQVWNPKFIKKNPYLLNIPNDSIKISYAASMGVESLTDEQKKMFKEALKEYSAISVREETARRLLQPLTSKKIEVVLDPTLLFDADDYIKLEKKPKDLNADSKYILCYILGGYEYQKVIDDYAKKNNLKVVVFSDKNDSDYGVEEFLYLIHHAELVCTDSFHACVFSFIFERPFVAFKRSGNENYMYSRLRNLIDTFHLKNREFNGKNITKENLKVDYTEGKKILKKEQEKSIKFLKNALGAEDE